MFSIKDGVLSVCLDLTISEYNGLCVYIVARMRGDDYRRGIGLTTGFIGPHTITVYTLYNFLLLL
jgi:hypothetical protein